MTAGAYFVLHDMTATAQRASAAAQAGQILNPTTPQAAEPDANGRSIQLWSPQVVDEQGKVQLDQIQDVLLKFIEALKQTA